MPVYNSERFLNEAISSVLKQSYDDIELVIINDGSTDNSDRIIRNYISNDKVKYISKANSGPANTRNVGIKSSNGDYIAFLDSDDVWLAHKIETQIKRLNETDADIIYSRRSIIDEHSNIICEHDERKLYAGSILNELYVDNFVCLSSVLLKNEVFNRVGFFNEHMRMSEDYDFWLRAALSSRFEYVNEELLQYRIHGLQASARYLERLIAVDEIYNGHYAELSGRISKQTIHKSRSLHYLNWGYFLKKNNRKYEAILMYLKAFRQNPSFIVLRYMLGLLKRNT